MPAEQQCPECESPLRPCRCEREDEYVVRRGWNSTLGVKKGFDKRGGRINPRSDRRDEEWHRAYGGEDRVRWVKRQQCCVPGCRRQAECAHIESGGMGRKADADKTARLCPRHHRNTHPESLHNLGSVARFDERWGTDLAAEAADLERRWQEHRRCLDN